MSKERIGFVGLGIMGLPIARHLLAAGHELGVWARAPERIKPIIEAGATFKDSPAALTRDADVVFTCVTNSDDVAEVVFGENGIAAGAGKDKVLVDLSSIHPLRTREMSARLRAETGMGWVDSPVSGGPAGAEEGTLAAMAGGEQEDFERVKPIVELFSGRFTLMGPSGAGQATKVCNQMIIAGSLAGIAEAINLATIYGLDAGAIPDCLAGGWADSPLLQNHGRRMAAGDLPQPGPGFWIKDLNIACDLGMGIEAPLPVISLIAELTRAVRNADGDNSQFALMRRLIASRP